MSNKQTNKQTRKQTEIAHQNQNTTKINRRKKEKTEGISALLSGETCHNNMIDKHTALLSTLNFKVKIQSQVCRPRHSVFCLSKIGVPTELFNLTV